MNDLVESLPGIERIKIRFVSLLEERQNLIANHVLAAWDSKDPGLMRSNLEAAQSALHQIAGSAGSLGFDQLGQSASHCENEIIDHLKDPEIDKLPLPLEIMRNIDAFLKMSQALITVGS